MQNRSDAAADPVVSIQTFCPGMKNTRAKPPAPLHHSRVGAEEQETPSL